MAIMKLLFGRSKHAPTSNGPLRPAASAVDSAQQSPLAFYGGSSSQYRPRPLAEKDNVGTRCETQGEGEAYFVSLFQKAPEPIIFYFFDSKEKATRALAEVPCMGIAADSKKLVCNDLLTFGVFLATDRDGSQTCGALLAGKSLTHELWSEARECFVRHGGRKRREDEPSKTSVQTRMAETDPNLVSFSHEIQKMSFGRPATYRLHTGPNKSSAITHGCPV